MRNLILWLARDEIARLNVEHTIELKTIKTTLDSFEQEIERLMKENETLEKKITGLEAVIAYAKDLHEQMFGIIKSFAPRQYPDSSLSQVGGIKSWQGVQKELEKRSRKE